MLSAVQAGAHVTFPAFQQERIYMKEFHRGDDLGRWNETVDQMLYGVEAKGPIYLMVDQQKLGAGTTHRRPGVHVDGWWNPAIQMHGENRHQTAPDSGHKTTPRHMMGHNTHIIGDEYKKEILILASDVVGCKAYTGEYNPPFGSGGDMSHLDLNKFNEVVMEANTAWIGDVWMLHESIPHVTDCLRTVVRLNVTVH